MLKWKTVHVTLNSIQLSFAVEDGLSKNKTRFVKAFFELINS